MIQVKRVYEPATAQDGPRFLVDQLWPRGLKKDKVKAKLWLKAVSPSGQLRHWFGHEPSKWNEFQRRYAAELDKKPETWRALLAAAREEDSITLLYSARDTQHNNAVALKGYLEKRLKGAHGSTTRADLSRRA